MLVGVRSESSVGAVAKSYRGKDGYKKTTSSSTSRDKEGQGGSSSSKGASQSGFKGKCFKCEGPHMAKNCPDKKIVCYKCGEEDHISLNCSSEN